MDLGAGFGKFHVVELCSRCLQIANTLSRRGEDEEEEEGAASRSRQRCTSAGSLQLVREQRTCWQVHW